MNGGALFLFSAHCFLTSGFVRTSGVDRKSNDFGLHTVSNRKKFDGILSKMNPRKNIDSNDITTTFKGNKEESNESTNEDSKETYVTDGFYDYDHDECGEKNGDEGVNKEDKSNESDENGDENEVDANNNKNEDCGTNDKQDDVSRYWYDYMSDSGSANGYNIDSKSEKKPLSMAGKYASNYWENRNASKGEEDTNDNGTNKQNSDSRHRKYSVYHDVNNQDSDNERGNDRNLGGNGSEMNKDKIWSISDKNGAKYVADYIVEYAESASGSNQNGKARCFFGWRLDANGVCAPPRKEC
jgi:hypothetical protein